jgi:hypothetical protein
MGQPAMGETHADAAEKKLKTRTGSKIYPLVNSHITMERSTIFYGKIHYKWSFSIATLNYQRVFASCSIRRRDFELVSGFEMFRGSTFLSSKSQSLATSRVTNISLSPGERFSQVNPNVPCVVEIPTLQSGQLAPAAGNDLWPGAAWGNGKDRRE